MRKIMIFVIGLTFGIAGGFTVAAGSGIKIEGHDHAEMDHSTMDHSATGHSDAGHAMLHDMPLEIDAASAPTIDIMVTKDLMAGYNLHVVADGFRFAPKSASLAHVAGEGHAHIYVNGVKLARLYSDWYHLDTLPKGDVEIEVSLNSNDHRPLALDGTLITAKKIVTVD
ncbi:hypothetical protein [uncultured Sulfitobacter sp.]|uniref:hypothetical protein n=1 Tax=uncultured Sulfitobacter sp. TaxID=191468 RepID=UPI00263536CD|nr:hypothetical protein [uncultured Sulfitobacter sp.]